MKFAKGFSDQRISVDDKAESLNTPEELCLCMDSEYRLATYFVLVQTTPKLMSWSHLTLDWLLVNSSE